MDNKIIGTLGEEIGRRYLINKKFKIVGSNIKLQKDEIDIVCVKNNTPYFIEVKTKLKKSSISLVDKFSHNKLRRMYRSRNTLSRVVKFTNKPVLGVLFIVLDINNKTGECDLLLDL